MLLLCVLISRVIEMCAWTKKDILPIHGSINTEVDINGLFL